ncbi:MAG: guanylate kinase [Acidobacteria bacterium]|nr:guanylate kinase [Acidobacteriota bacterium]
MRFDPANKLPKRRGSIFVISAPSGTGKSTLIQRLRILVRGLAFSVSYTTRPPRAGEKNGREYFFVSRAEFKQRMARKEFVEWAEVHGHHYGTSWQQLQKAQEAGQDVLLDIDVQGYKKLRRRIPETVSVFLLPPSFRELEKRLRHRHKDAPEVIAKRLEASRKEVAHWKEYDYLIVNDRRATAVQALRDIVLAARWRRECQERRVKEISKTFVGG